MSEGLPVVVVQCDAGGLLLEKRVRRGRNGLPVLAELSIQICLFPLSTSRAIPSATPSLLDQVSPLFCAPILLDYLICV